MKVKDRVKELESEVKRNKYEIKKLKFQLENPPKYKVGDEIGQLLITGFELSTIGLLPYIGEEYVYNVFDKRGNKTVARTEAEIMQIKNEGEKESQILSVPKNERANLSKKEQEIGSLFSQAWAISMDIDKNCKEIIKRREKR